MRKVLKVMMVIIGGLVGLLVVVFVALAAFGAMKYKPKHADRPLYPITADTSPEGLARGKYLLENAMDCTHACHTPENGAQLSGRVEEINMTPVWARFSVPNLTPDPETGLGSWSDAEIARAIREGIDEDGRELVIMPSYSFTALSDADVAAIVGYLRSIEPVKHEVPPFDTNIFGKIFLALGMFGPKSAQEPITAAQMTPEKGTVENGAYLVAIGGCRDCHNANLAGGKVALGGPEDPPAANLTPAGELVGWTVEDFTKAVQTGIKPSGKELAELMPRYQTNSDDLADIFAYLKTIAPAQPAK